MAVSLVLLFYRPPMTSTHSPLLLFFMFSKLPFSSTQIGNLPYLADLLRLLPNPMLVLDSWVSAALTERLETLPKSGDNQSDIISHLIKENKSLDTKKLSFRELQAESGLIVVGGSDTSSNTISLALFHLIHEPGAYQKVQHEVEQCFPGSVADDFSRLAKDCPYLNAVIQETLRLWPPGELM